MLKFKHKSQVAFQQSPRNTLIKGPRLTTAILYPAIITTHQVAIYFLFYAPLLNSLYFLGKEM